MAVWETMDDPDPVMRDFAEIWRAGDKVVYSRTLDDVSTARTRLEREFEPDAVRAMKAAADRDVLIGGPELAAVAWRAGLVDECWFVVAPVVLGGGKPALPAGVRASLELVDERRFANGSVFVRYAVV